ncbi:MAG TPA: hypothetical protein VIW29_22490 [Polyangiaceae bacterium]
MFGSRTAIGVGCCALLVALIGCGGAVEHSGDEPSVGTGGRTGTPSQHKAGSAGVPTAGSTSVAGASAGTASGGFPNLPDDPPPVTSGCDTAGEPPVTNECDPFGASSCLAGMACYPFVDHPEGDGCGTQTYGTVCLPNGIGTQGMHCGDETGDWCAAGHVCVVGQRAGKRCAKLCQLGKADQCQGGLVCADLDVAGYGVCG